MLSMKKVESRQKSEYDFTLKNFPLQKSKKQIAQINTKRTQYMRAKKKFRAMLVARGEPPENIEKYSADEINNCYKPRKYCFKTKQFTQESNPTSVNDIVGMEPVYFEPSTFAELFVEQESDETRMNCQGCESRIKERLELLYSLFDTMNALYRKKCEVAGRNCCIKIGRDEFVTMLNDRRKTLEEIVGLEQHLGYPKKCYGNGSIDVTLKNGVLPGFEAGMRNIEDRSLTDHPVYHCSSFAPEDLL